jgi:hypothetical protein
VTPEKVSRLERLSSLKIFASELIDISCALESQREIEVPDPTDPASGGDGGLHA